MRHSALASADFPPESKSGSRIEKQMSNSKEDVELKADPELKDSRPVTRRGSLLVEADFLSYDLHLLC
jgi:hypothetical protein